MPSSACPNTSTVLVLGASRPAATFSVTSLNAVLRCPGSLRLTEVQATPDKAIAGAMHQSDAGAVLNESQLCPGTKPSASRTGLGTEIWNFEDSVAVFISYLGSIDDVSVRVADPSWSTRHGSGSISPLGP